MASLREPAFGNVTRALLWFSDLEEPSLYAFGRGARCRISALRRRWQRPRRRDDARSCQYQYENRSRLLCARSALLRTRLTLPAVLTQVPSAGSPRGLPHAVSSSRSCGVV